MADALYARPARELRDLVRKRDVTAREVAQSFLDRIESVDARVGAYLDVWGDHALAQAGAVDARIAKGNDPGPLAGVPIGLKDNLCTSYGTTTCSSKVLAGFESPYDATIVNRLRDAGAVFLGKLNMDEFAMGSSTENSSVQRTCNPWDLGRVPGGSSGGAAAGLVSDEAALTIGSDTGGSIRQPAAFCGCLGLKPTYGRVSRYGVVAFASSLDQIGPFAKNTEDLAIAMNAISGHDPLDATSADLPVPDYTKSLTGDLRGLTIGLPREFYTDALNEKMREKLMAAVDVLRGLGAKTVDVSLPHTDYGIAVYYIIAPAEASSNLARFDGVRYGYRSAGATTVEEMYKLTKTEGFGPEVRRRIMLGTYVLSSGYYDAYYLKAQKVRALIRRDFDEAFAKCDVIVTPTTPTPAFAFGEKTDDPLQMYLNDIYTNSVNLAGVPGLSVPCGLIDGRLPAGMQIIGKPFSEDLLIRVSHAYEKNRGFDPGKPPLN
jgi:aspartyl-tRNA(Asn)/glutamyl-tRNA(Gln) amidotransferase subunit A